MLKQSACVALWKSNLRSSIAVFASKLLNHGVGYQNARLSLWFLLVNIPRINISNSYSILLLLSRRIT